MPTLRHSHRNMRPHLGLVPLSQAQQDSEAQLTVQNPGKQGAETRLDGTLGAGHERTKGQAKARPNLHQR